MGPADHPLAVFVRILAGGFLAAMPLPDWADLRDLRRWLRRLAPVLRELARRTHTTVDDATAALAERIVESDVLWEAACRVVIDRLKPSGATIDEKPLLTHACAEADGRTGAIDPDLVRVILEDVAGLIRLTRAAEQAAAAPEATAPVGAGGEPVETEDDA